MVSWQEVWTRKAAKHGGADYSLATLMELDGYDISVSSVSERDFVDFAVKLVERLDLKPGQSVLEIGCGAGALCFALAEMGFEVAGIDYTPKLIEICQAAIPSGEFYVGEAAELDLPKKDYDAVISHSVFHYFPSTDYALKAYRRMAEHTAPGGIVGLTDMHDERLREEHEERRKAMIGEAEYNRLYAELRHSYFMHDDFAAAATAMGAQYWIEDQFLKSQSGRYKFNFFSRS